MPDMNAQLDLFGIEIASVATPELPSVPAAHSVGWNQDFRMFPLGDLSPGDRFWRRSRESGGCVDPPLFSLGEGAACAKTAIPNKTIAETVQLPLNEPVGVELKIGDRVIHQSRVVGFGGFHPVDRRTVYLDVPNQDLPCLAPATTVHFSDGGRLTRPVRLEWRYSADCGQWFFCGALFQGSAPRATDGRLLPFGRNPNEASAGHTGE